MDISKDGYTIISEMGDGYGWIMGFSDQDTKELEKIGIHIEDFVSMLQDSDISFEIKDEECLNQTEYLEEKECIEQPEETCLRPEDIIYDPPATRVYWNDGTKTEVKTHNEPFVKEFGYAMALARKIYNGNRSAFLKDVESGYTRTDKTQ